jgi:hypothetical protein
VPNLVRGSPLLSVTRRSLLRGLLGIAGAGLAGAAATGALAGCDLIPHGAEGGAEPHALDGLLVATVALGDRYDATVSTVSALAPTLVPLRDAHRAHAVALASALGREVPRAPADAAPVPADRVAAVAALAILEKKGRDEAVAACLASQPRLAALLGSVAAARASHLEILK